MMGRAQEQQEDYENELDYIRDNIGDTYRMEAGSSQLTDWIAAYGEDAYNEFNNRKTDLDEWLSDITAQIHEYEEQAEAYAAEKARLAEQRAI
jgi:peptidoglycan hydrolase CwlO-like protein